MISCAGRRLAVLATPPQPLERMAGLEAALSFLACPEQLSERSGRTGWQRRVLATRRRPQWSEQRELKSRHQLGRLRHQPLYHARLWREMQDSNPHNWIWRPVS